MVPHSFLPGVSVHHLRAKHSFGLIPVVSPAQKPQVIFGVPAAFCEWFDVIDLDPPCRVAALVICADISALPTVAFEHGVSYSRPDVPRAFLRVALTLNCGSLVLRSSFVPDSPSFSRGFLLLGSSFVPVRPFFALGLPISFLVMFFELLGPAFLSSFVTHLRTVSVDKLIHHSFEHILE